MLPIKISDPITLPRGVESGEKLFVMTDIHGSPEAMKRLLSKRPEGSKLVFLGDSTDRGPGSVEVLRFLDGEEDAVLLRGNHDIMAWYAIHGDPSFSRIHLEKLRELWTEYNGGVMTLRSFILDAGDREVMDPCDYFRKGMTNALFDRVYEKSLRYWRSGDLVFVHGGLPSGREDEWLAKPETYAVSMTWETESHWAWYRPNNNYDGYYDEEQRTVDGRPAYIVCGHTPQSYDWLVHEYGMFVDTGYALKTAAIIDGNSVRFVMTPCDEVMECDDVMGIFG